METRAAKTVASGLYQIKKDVVGTSRNAYWAEYRPKEVRDKEKAEMLEEKAKFIPKNEFGIPLSQSPTLPDEVSSGIVMHRSGRLAEAWEKFKTDSFLGQTMHGYKRSMDESENPMLRMWRDWKERSVANEPETVRVIRAFKTIEPDFDQHSFLREAANFMIADILDAYLKGDAEVLREWGTEAVFKNF